MPTKEVEYCVLLINKEQDDKNAGILKKCENSLYRLFAYYEITMAEMTGKAQMWYDVLSAYRAGQIDTLCIAVDKDYNVYGFIVLEADMITRTLWTSHIYVDSNVRRSGVYTLMMKRVKKFAEDAKFNRIFSLVHKENKVSKQAHRKIFGNNQWLGYEMEIKHEDK